VTRWPGGGGDYVGRWPGRLQRETRVEPPAWFRVFVLEDWARPGDDEVRYPAGAPMPAREVAERRWRDERRKWADANGMSIVDWLRECRATRLAERGWDP
jgi:hypothetical protein